VEKGVAARRIIIVGVVRGKSIVLHFSQADEIAARCSPAVGSKLARQLAGDVGDARRVGLCGEREVGLSLYPHPPPLLKHNPRLHLSK
jgi:hypothetical protein